ncbi:MAG: Holliday junction resolvase RuvX [Chloroflexi bacterium]|nr:Holliday junction resolvase RuvX [Chloroflexota bacterium]MCI0856329.1 Holliday junction resolvase RuvX [Chloroflexota bacterium]MCI0889560.1 Holliday junction resolvase RuvX [Chloroflexota bacterium]
MADADRSDTEVERILGLDVGERRIGVAISTPEAGLAIPLRIIDVLDRESDVRSIVELARSENASLVIVGHPISMDGTVGPQARKIEAFAKTLQEKGGLKVELYDERLSTAQARRAPSSAGKRRAPVDDVAASIILQSYLDSQRAGQARGA